MGWKLETSGNENGSETVSSPEKRGLIGKTGDSRNLPDRDEVLEEVLREVRKLRTVFRLAGLDAKTFRRRLRRASPERRFSLTESEHLHRSQASKLVFADAEHLAELGGGFVYPIHLLYAIMLNGDKHRDNALAGVGLVKKDLLAALKQQIIMHENEKFDNSKRARSRWN